MAFTLAAGMAMAPAPAQAQDQLFYGRPGPIAEKKALYEVRSSRQSLLPRRLTQCVARSCLEVSKKASAQYKSCHVEHLLQSGGASVS